MIRIGTRGSALALAQATLVLDGLTRLGAAAELVVVETAGDRRAPDTAWGEGAFVKAIELALLEDRIDVAVHSAKDVPTAEDPRLRIVAYLERADARDALVVREGLAAPSLERLPVGARVGTDSPRRTGFLLALRPDLRLHPLHGNVDTRLRRLDAGESDALVLAVAGLTRLGRADRITEALDPEVVPPAPGQGAIAIQMRAGDGRAELVRRLDHRPTRVCAEAERSFLAASGGGCRAPIGAHATLDAERVTMLGGYTEPDGHRAAFERIDGVAADVVDLGRALADRLLATFGARPVLQPPVPDPRDEAARESRRVLVTRPAEQARELVEALTAAGLAPVVIPAIAIETVDPDAATVAAVRALPEYDWVLVTSANGARALLDVAARLGVPPGDGASRPLWAAVGRATASVVEAAGVRVAHVPSRQSGQGLADSLPAQSGERVLLARGDLAGSDLPATLRGRGVLVDEITLYRTVEAPPSSAPQLAAVLADGPPAAVVHASPSAVRGLIALAAIGERDRVRSLPTVCIGPETAAEARRLGVAVAAEAMVPDAQEVARAASEVVLAVPAGAAR